MRRILYVATLLIGAAVGSLYQIDLFAQNRASIGNLIADNAAAGTKLGLSVVILDGSGNPVTSFGGTGGTSMTDDAAFTVGSGFVTPVAGIYRSSLDSVNDGDAGALAMLANRILMVNMVDANGDALSVGGGTQYTEDAAAAANPVGNVPILVRTDTLSAVTVTTDGDNIAARGTSKGEAYTHDTDVLAKLPTLGTAGSSASTVISVQGIASGTAMPISVASIPAHAVTNAGTFAVQCSNCSGTGASWVDDTAFTVATDSVAPTGFLADMVAPDSVNEGDVGVARMTLARIQLNTLWDAAGNERGANVNASNELLVALSSVPSHAVTNVGTFAVQAATTAADGSNVTLGAKADAKSTATDTTSITMMQVLKQISASVQAPPSQAVTNAGTFSVQCSSGCGASVADDAAFTIATTTVMPAGFLADQTSPDSVDEGDVGAARMTLARIQLHTIWDAAGNERGANVNASGQLAVAGPVTNAGTFVVQVDGAALTALQLIDNLPNTLGSTTSGQYMVVTGGAVTTAAPTYTNAQSNAFSLQTDGSLRVAVTNGAAGGTSVADNASFTDNSTNLTPIGGVAEVASPTTCTEAKECTAATTLNRALKVTLYAVDGSALTPSNDSTHDSAVSATGPSGMLEAKDFDGAALPNVVSAEGDAVRAAGSLYGVQYTMLVSEDGSLQYGTATTPLVVGGNVAHDGADSGNPIKLGLKATSSLSALTMVATADRTDAFGGLDGVQITRPHSNLEDRVSGVVGVTDGSSTSLVAAQGSGIRYCATTFVVSNSSTSNVTVDIRDGTAGAVLMTIPAAANMGGAVISLQTPICTTANTAMATDPSSAASTVTTTAVGFKTKL